MDSLKVLDPKRPIEKRTSIDCLKSAIAVIAAVRRTGFIERQARSLRFDDRELDHLGPFLGFGCNESAELGGAKNHWDGTEVDRSPAQMS